ncbi:MAG: pseudouridine synthase [Bradyrhizobium sp.]|nr:MAG: pseudouridine synthase [Bradyrhizobium sp.]
MSPVSAHAERRDGQRIAKVMARAGLCSRRDAEAWVLAGRVSVNGQILASPAYNVGDSDEVRVDGQPLRARERTRLFLFHKPRGLVTTARDPEGRPTIFDALPPDLPRVVAVGRLDTNTEGLILLTNDGGLARILELPATGWLRRYRVRAHGEVEQSALDALSEGVSIEGVHYAGIEARLERQQGANVWLSMGLREGKNREIKRVLDHLGLAVNRLIRVSFGPFELGDLEEGDLTETPTRVLRDQLGPKLAREAQVDFDAPIVARTPVAAPPPAPETREARRETRPSSREGGRDHAPRSRDDRPSPRGDRSPPREDRRRPDSRDAPPPSRDGRDPRRASRPASREGGKDYAPRARDDRASPRGDRKSDDPRARAPEPSHPQRKRKHVGRLRAEIAAEAEGSRKRIERSATADRKGRVVAVERILPSREEQRRRDEAARKVEARRDRRGSSEESAPRRDEGKSFDKRPPFGKSPRFDKSAHYEKSGSARGAARPPRDSKSGGDRPPRRGPPSRGGRPDGKFGGKSGGKPGGGRPPRRP